MSKTNAVGILESKSIRFEIFEYDFDDDKLDGISAATKLNAEIESVFKTFVTYGDKTGYNIFCIPSNFELDLKKAAKVSRNKNIEMIKLKDLFEITGYIRGGCSPVGMKKEFPTFIDETALLFPGIYVSAGVRGMQIKINPDVTENYYVFNNLV